MPLNSCLLGELFLSFCLRYSSLMKAVLRIRIGFNADPDTDPDPGF
jgi:hypothetical protein